MLVHPAGTTHRDRFHQRVGRFPTVSIKACARWRAKSWRSRAVARFSTPS
jgi:hypothetical protein